MNRDATNSSHFGPKTGPKVSVIMPAYNGGKYIAKAIESVLNQTLKDIELIIIDDGSTDNTVDIIKKYTDPRIRFFQNEKNEGISVTSNKAIQASLAPYIAPLDQDDITDLKRLETEFNFLEKHPDFGFVGGWISLMGEYSESLRTTHKSFLPPEKIPATLLFINCFDNGSTLIRKSALPQGEVYRNMSPAQDYDLWLRIDKKWKMWNMPHIFLHYRIHENNTSTTRRTKRKEVVRVMLKEALMRLGLEPTEEEIRLHCTNDMYYGEDLASFFEMREAWLQKLELQNNTVRYYEPKIFEQVVAERWLNTCSKNTRMGIWVWKRFWQSELCKKLDTKVNFALLLRFFITCCFKKDYLKRPIHKKAALITLLYFFNTYAIMSKIKRGIYYGK